MEGPTGLTMLKTLREDGFDVTLYERRSQVGGLWAYTENPAYTTALAGSVDPKGLGQVCDFWACQAEIADQKSNARKY